MILQIFIPELPIAEWGKLLSKGTSPERDEIRTRIYSLTELPSGYKLWYFSPCKGSNFGNSSVTSLPKIRVGSLKAAEKYSNLSIEIYSLTKLTLSFEMCPL
jgi:hypothetical protein